MSKAKQNMLVYRVAQAISGALSSVVFKRKFIRNELKNIEGPAVVIGNHQAALDFTTLIGATKRPITFVVSYSFYNTLPIRSLMDKIGVIPKQQFQTTIKEIVQMKTAVKDGKILMLYPAGLMCEDGLSTPIPCSTYAFLKRLDADVYVARTAGTYFCTPKWSAKIRPGRTYMDIYKLITKEVAIGFGMISHAVQQINEGENLKILIFEEGAPYSLYGQAVIAGNETSPAVMEVFDFLVNHITPEMCERFYPEKLYKDKDFTIKNFPADVTYSDMSNNTPERKAQLLGKWSLS